MFTLYYDKEKRIIQVNKATKGMQSAKYTDDVTIHNSNYYICDKRKPLVVKAKQMQQAWISELEQDLEKLKKLKL